MSRAIVAIIIGLSGLVGLPMLLGRPWRDPPTRKHRGIEMKARNGRLVHFRQTESEK